MTTLNPGDDDDDDHDAVLCFVLIQCCCFDADVLFFMSKLPIQVMGFVWEEVFWMVHFSHI